MLQLATVLKSKDFSITVAHAHFNSLDYSVFPDFTFLCIPDGLSEEEVQNPDLKAIMLRLNVNRESSLREYLARSTNHMGPGDKICCIIYDAVVYFLEAVAHDLKIPSIASHTSSAAPTIVCPILLQLKAFRSQVHVEFLLFKLHLFLYSMLQAPVPLHQLLRFKDLPLSNFGSLDYFLELVVLTSNMRSSLAIIFNTIHCLEESPLAQLYQRYQVPIFPIGPPHKLTPTSAQTHNSVQLEGVPQLLAHQNQDQLYEMAWGLANSRELFLWVIRPGSIPAPRKKVLAHEAVGGFWSHCGWHSTLESICEGVLMICQPCFGDQKVNARYLTHEWRVGLELEGEIERRTIERAMRQRVLDLKHKCGFSIGDGGSSCHYLSELVGLLRSF
ncbi:hypothetical protein ACJRO7_004913 [Eucalyptus globulus]|uniref:Uncharacterized protein n=1 Tax=Eucalyptus globulus TaxID=34317 RepID=A0ABD3J3H4_EUCGL